MGILKKTLIFFAATLLIYRFCLIQTDGFSIARISSDLPLHLEWEADTLKKSVKQILNQPFYYLDSGAQTFAFSSEDDQYVLKFYRHHRASHALSFLTPLLPPYLKNRLQQTLDKRINKRLKDFTSYKLAYDLLQEETGLLFIQLNKNPNLNVKLKAYDRIGVVHSIDLSKMEFLLQKKASPLFSTLEKWIDDGDLTQAEKGISNLLALLHRRCLKGIFDKDPDLKTNFGFIGVNPIQFDVGRFKNDPTRSDRAIYHTELVRITDRLKCWLEERSDHLSNYLKEELKQY